MDTPFKNLAISLAAEAEARLAHLLSTRNMSREHLIKTMFTDPSTVDHELKKEIYYLDAYSKIVNMENYTPNWKDFRPKDYLDALMPDLYKWADVKNTEDFMSKLKGMAALPGAQISDENLFTSLLLAAIWRESSVHAGRIKETVPERAAPDTTGSDGPEAA